MFEDDYQTFEDDCAYEDAYADMVDLADPDPVDDFEDWQCEDWMDC